MPSYRAVKSWQIHYPDPVRGAAGDRLALGREDDEYPGWVWATDIAGREGWVPRSWLRIEGDGGVLLRDYTAAELVLQPDDVVSGELAESGWLWATTAGGRTGWAPLDCLEQITRDA